MSAVFDEFNSFNIFWLYTAPKSHAPNVTGVSSSPDMLFSISFKPIKADEACPSVTFGTVDIIELGNF
jgi:hypothetical protein